MLPRRALFQGAAGLTRTRASFTSWSFVVDDWSWSPLVTYACMCRLSGPIPRGAGLSQNPVQVAESGAVDCASPAVERAAGRSRAHRSGRARRVQTRAAREICPEGFCFQSLLDTIRRRPPSCPPWPNRAGLSYCYLLVRTLPCSTLPLLRPSSSRHPKKRMRNYQFSNRKCRLKRGLPLQKGGGLLDDNRFPEILLAPPRSPTGGHLVRGCVEKQLADNVCFAFSDLTSFDHQPSAQRPC